LIDNKKKKKSFELCLGALSEPHAHPHQRIKSLGRRKKMSGQRDFYGTLDGMPDTSDGKRKRDKDGQFCLSDHTLNIIQTVAVVVLGLAFCGLLIGILSKKEDLDATTRATVGMHDDTIKLRQDAETWLKGFREHFPSNQETLSVEQVVGIIDKAHNLMQWADRVTQGVDSRTVTTIANNVNTFVGNATLFVEVLTSVFGVKNAQTTTNGLSAEKRDRLVESTSTLLTKISDLIHAVKPDEFHGFFMASSEAVTRVVDITRSVENDRLRKIVESTSDLLSAADTEHVVGVLANLTRGATDMMHRLSQPAGLRVSLPLDG
jgi:hypothetical protein